MANFKAAVIGLGRMGSTFDDEIERGGSIHLPYCHGPSYFYSSSVDLVAGADVNDEQRALFGERWELGGDHLYTDYMDMVERERPDVVSVCTTARPRAKIMQDLARSGIVKAIWAEKPFTLSLEEADAVLETCRENGVQVAVNCARRWNPTFRKAREIIDAGELGEVLQVTAYGSAAISHNGSHMIDTVRYLSGGDGKIDWVFGEMESDEAAASDDDLQGNGYLAFANGVRSYIRTTGSGAANWDMEVVGELGRFRSLFNGMEEELVLLKESDADSAALGPSSSRVVGPIPTRVPFPRPARPRGAGLDIVDDIVNSIETDTPPTCSGDDGRAALEVAIAMRESHRRGGVRVDLPLADRSLMIRSVETKDDDVPVRIRREIETGKRAG